jgi:hypothetical protein
MEELCCSCVGRRRNGGARINELSPDSPWLSCGRFLIHRGSCWLHHISWYRDCAANKWKHSNSDQNEESPVRATQGGVSSFATKGQYTCLSFADGVVIYLQSDCTVSSVHSI